MSRAATAALALFVGVFIGVLAWLFPTDAVVRRALASATAPDGTSLVFRRATLRLDGIHLDDVTVHGAGGAVLAHADDVRAHPSLLGLLRDGGGFPWTLDTTACGGRLDARIVPDGAVTAVAATWDGGDLAACPLLPIAAGALAGRAHGVARVRVPAAGWPEGEGRVDVEAGRWEGHGDLQGFGALRAEAASVRWTLRDGRLLLDAVELRGPDVSARGSGTVDLVEPLPDSAVELTLAVATAPEAGGLLRLLVGPPGRERGLRVGGTLARPSALVQ